VHAAALPAGCEHAANGSLQSLMGVRDDQPGAAQASTGVDTDMVSMTESERIIAFTVRTAMLSA
jgi:hypothetical protein